MTKQKRHITLGWIVLICFIAGQTMIYSHQHADHANASPLYSVKTHQPLQTVTDKCNICDMMLHTHMAIFSNGTISPQVTICNTLYTRQHDYIGIALILSAGRSPPVTQYS